MREGGGLQIMGMFFTLWLACVSYLAPLDKRPHVKARAAAMLVLAAAASGLTALLGPWPDWLALSAIFGFSILFFLVCGDLPLSGALYAAVWAQISQQLVAETYLLLHWVLSPRVDWGPWVWVGVGALLFAAAYGVVAFTVARWMPSQGKYAVGPRQLTLSLVFQVIFEVLCWMLLADLDLGSTGLLYPASVWLAQCYCATMLYFQYTLFTKSAMKKELEILNHMWHQQEEQYRLSKETIAIINRKCHDMKHQIAAVRAMAGSEAQERYLREAEESVSIYDAIFQTGNEVLDTVLTEKSLYCEANGIRLGCVADGKQLAVLDPVDVYAVIGNALDNAIEAVQELDEPEKRMIDVLICREQKFLVVQVVNPMAGELKFRDGLPMSTKARDGYHGFGLKSIRHTVEQYGGFAAVRAEGGYFCLKILIPLRDQGGADRASV